MSSTDSNLRSIERKRQTKRIAKRNRRIVTFSLAIIIGLFGVYAFYFSSWLTVKKISVTGNTIATSVQIQTSADIQIGTPLAKVSSDQINLNLAAISSVDHVEVRRAWPNEIILVVSERKAIATIKEHNYWVFVDAKGVTYGKTFNQPKDLMVLATSSNPALIEAAKVYGEVPKWLDHQIKSVTATSRDNVRLVMIKNRTAIIGDYSRLTRKFAVLKVLLTQKARIYDVSAPDVPVTRK